MSRRYLLSIDGGGIRGILPAVALARLERVTGRPAREIFSFAAGTSTGALIAAAVAAGIPATRIVDLYLNRAREIFSPRAPWNTIKRVATGSMYSSKRLARILAEEFGEAAGWMLNDSPIDLLLTAKGMDGKPWYFVRDKAANSKLTGRLSLVECATASAAAPTYFDPWRFANAPEIGVVVDGGVGVTGNPVYQACVEAFYYTGEYTPEQTTVVSLGTGLFPHKSEPPKTLIGWVDWVMAELLRSPGEQQTQIVRQEFPEMQFYRIDPDMSSFDHKIDMDGVEQAGVLRDFAEKFAQRIDWAGILAGTDEEFRAKSCKAGTAVWG
jgi:patatin-like phospholipase/acyl hydrolase